MATNPQGEKHRYRVPVAASNADGECVVSGFDVTVVENGEGPTILFTGGIHGDELEGPVALRRLARTLTPAAMRGRVIIVPVVNETAFAAGRRTSPHDDLDLNRAFPGDPAASLTPAIASALLSLVDLADVVIDLHAGGTRYSLISCVLVHPLQDPGLMMQTLDAGVAFGAPMCVLIDEGQKAGMFDTEVEKREKIFLCAELGRFGSLSPDTVGISERGINNILSHFGVVDGHTNPAGTDIIVSLKTDQHHQSPSGGLFEPLVEVGTIVMRGAHIGFVDTLDGSDPFPIAAQTDGTVFFRHAGGMIEAEDVVFILGQSSSKANALRDAVSFAKSI